jgi:hypothetical protein
MPAIVRRLLMLAIVSALCLAGDVTSAAEVAGEWHVSPQGNDAHAGTRAQPFATLERARDAARARDRSAEAINSDTIWLSPGLHRRTRTLDLDERDSKLVIRGPADRGARVHAGRFVDPAAFVPVRDPRVVARLDPAARGRVLVLDMKAAGLPAVAVPPDVFRDGGGLPELFIDDARLPLARWPDDGPATMGDVLEKGEQRGRGGAFISRDDRVARWRVEDGVWLEGYWRVPWDPVTIRVAAIDPATRRIDFAGTVSGGIGSKYAPKGKKGDGKEPWWAVNLLEEIDREGEWCVHTASGMLYVWPPKAFGATSRVFVGGIREPVVKITGARAITLQSLTIEGGSGAGVEIVGGRDGLVLGCTFRKLGGTAVVVTGGTAHAVRSCDIFDIGDAGIRLVGGDRAGLEPCGHEAINNDVHHVGIRRKTYAAAIHLGDMSFQGKPARDAVGCHVANNYLHDLPHAAVLYTGNDHLLERNEVCRVALTSGDVGAFYSSLDWTSHGNVLRHNLVHDCPRANAFYVDDGDSGDTIEGNLVIRSACGAFLGGGHDNIVRHNVMVECAVGIHVDSRGVSRGYHDNPRLRSRLASARADTEPWSVRYPTLARLLDPATDAGRPHGILIAENVTVRCGTSLRKSGRKGELDGVSIVDNLDLGKGTGGDDPLFIDPVKFDYGFAAASPVLRRFPAFPRIPIESIGLQNDLHRPRLPARDAAAAPTGPQFDSHTDLEATNDAAARADAARKASP